MQHTYGPPSRYALGVTLVLLAVSLVAGGAVPAFVVAVAAGVTAILLFIGA